MTIWKERAPRDRGPDLYDCSDELGIPAMCWAERPDYVRRPDTGEKVAVLSQSERELTCPGCRAGIRARVLELEGGLAVIACCACNQFLWVRNPPHNTTEGTP